ncbi:MAG TPA: hypothetical protein VGD71_18060 [Kribbella sp.]
MSCDRDEAADQVAVKHRVAGHIRGWRSRAIAEQDGSVAPQGIFDGRTALMASIHDQAQQAARQYADQAVMVAEKLKPGTYDSVRN